MGFFDIFKFGKKERLPLVARVDLAKMQEERNKNQELGDVAVLARKDYTKRLKNKIRLCYLSLGVHRENLSSPKVEAVQGASCIYHLPENMSIEDASKVVSYLFEATEKKNGIDMDSEVCLASVLSDLGNYGFMKDNTVEADYSHTHSVLDSSPYQETIELPSKMFTKISGVKDLFMPDGDFMLFLKSNMAGEDIDWFKSGVTWKEVKQIFARCGLEVNKNGVVNTKVKG